MTPCTDLILEMLKKPMKYEALYKKYSSRKFMKAALFVKNWIEENAERSEEEE
jgi:G2/mitotic-specific cyclin 1/2